MKAAGVARRIRARRARRTTERAARRALGHDEAMRTPSLVEAMRTADGPVTHVAIDERGNVSMVEVDPQRFAAAIDRPRTPAPRRRARLPAPDREADAEAGADAELVEDLDLEDGGSASFDVPSFDDDCPICRAIRESSRGPVRTWSPE